MPSQYLNQWWNIVNWTIRNKFQWNFYSYLNIFVKENAFENVVSEMAASLSWSQCVNCLLHWTTVYHIRRVHGWVLCMSWLYYQFLSIHVIKLYIFHMVALLVQCQWIDPSHNSHNVSDKYPKMHYFVTEMLTILLPNGALWNIGTGALWNVCEKSIKSGGYGQGRHTQKTQTNNKGRPNCIIDGICCG